MDRCIRRDIEKLAEEVCVWGGVPKKSSADTWKVVKSAALGSRHHAAPMDSGWTKVASFASIGLPKAGCPGTEQTIWDSRVSISIIQRLDGLLVRNGFSPGSITPCPNLKMVSGMGGTRPRKLVLHWRSGACDWPAHFAGSEVVREIRDILNDTKNRYPRMPLPNGKSGDWDVFGVGLVLFMDGY